MWAFSYFLFCTETEQSTLNVTLELVRAVHVRNCQHFGMQRADDKDTASACLSLSVKQTLLLNFLLLSSMNNIFTWEVRPHVCRILNLGPRLHTFRERCLKAMYIIHLSDWHCPSQSNKQVSKFYSNFSSFLPQSAFFIHADGSDCEIKAHGWSFYQSHLLCVCLILQPLLQTYFWILLQSCLWRKLPF